jgi:hypothetical protein
MKTSQLMLYREIIAVCSQIHTKHINTVCGQNVELVNVKLGGANDDHWGYLRHVWQVSISSKGTCWPIWCGDRKPVYCLLAEYSGFLRCSALSVSNRRRFGQCLFTLKSWIVVRAAVRTSCLITDQGELAWRFRNKNRPISECGRR